MASDQSKKTKLSNLSIKFVQPYDGLKVHINEKSVRNHERLLGKHGNVVPIVVSERSTDVYTIVDGMSALAAYQNMDITELPAIVVPSSTNADVLMLIMDMHLAHPVDMLGMSSSICRLIDEFGVPRKAIATAVGRSQPWVSMAEKVGRHLVTNVKGMVASGSICMRSAEEIVFLPADIQEPFANKVLEQQLSKIQIHKWVKDYTNPKCSMHTKDKMLADPIDYLLSTKKSAAPKISMLMHTIQQCVQILQKLDAITADATESEIDESYESFQELMSIASAIDIRFMDVFTRVKTEEE